MKKVFKQSTLTMPPPAKKAIIVFLAIAFFNVLAPMAKAQTLMLTPSNYNGNNVSCFGAQDGSINLTITGGTPPYQIRWTNDAITEDISNLPAGFYMVEVDDADSTTDIVSADITLTEPEELRIEITASDYIVNTRHYNISLSGACNGSITSTVTGGTAPYTFNWEPYGQTTANLTNICAGDYYPNVTDANGCPIPAEQNMTEPDRDDWQMTGNTGSSPYSHFIGTIDNQDLSLRTYNQERLRIAANGATTIKGLLNVENSIQFNNALKIGYVAAQNNYPAIMSFGANPTYTPFSIGSCFSPHLNSLFQFNGTLQLYGNTAFGGFTNVMEVGFDGANAIIDVTGTSSSPGSPSLLLNFYCGKNIFACTGTSGGNIQLGGTNSIVGIGINPNTLTYATTPYKLVVDGKVGVTKDIYVKSSAGAWPDYIFADNYQLENLSDIAAYFKANKHFKGFPTAAEVEANGQAVGTIQVLQQEKLEQAFLYIIEQDKRSALMEKKIEQLEKRIAELEK